MTCEELRPEYGAFALASAEDPERAEILAHLHRHCPECVAGVRSALATVAAMSGAVQIADPPKHLRKRLVAMVSPVPSRRRFAVWFPWAVAAVLALVLLSVSIPARFRNPNNTATAQARFDEVLSILKDPVTKDVAFGDPTARGRFFVSSNKGVVFIAAHLPKLQAGRTFEMWLIPASGKPVPAGTFDALGDSTAVYVRPGPVVNAAAMAISVEPAGGSAQPTTTPIVVSKL
jgi:anti-sigma-K factor RskA